MSFFGKPQIRIAPHKAVEALTANDQSFQKFSLQVDSFFEWESRTGHMKHFCLNLLFFRASNLCLLWRTNGLCFTTRLGGQARTFHGGRVAALLDGTKTLSPNGLHLLQRVFFSKSNDTYTFFWVIESRMCLIWGYRAVFFRASSLGNNT